MHFRTPTFSVLTKGYIIAFGLSKLISSLQRDCTLSERHHARLKIMQEAVQELTRNTKNLHESWKEVATADLWTEVDTLIDRIAKTHDVMFNVAYDRKYKIVSVVLVRELRFILLEAITNAIKHGSATSILLSFDMDATTLTLRIVDNGGGFDSMHTAEVGIANMRARARRLGGTFTIESSLGEGTRILVTAPV